MDKGLLDEAISAYSRAIELKPELTAAHFNLAGSFMANRQLEEAVKSYHQAIALMPDYFQAHVDLSIALAQLKRFDEAMLAQSRGRALRPSDPLTEQALGLILLGKGEISAAAGAFAPRPGRLARLGALLDALGTALKSLGQFEESSACYRRALSLHPDSAAAIYNNLAGVGRQAAKPAEGPAVVRVARSD